MTMAGAVSSNRHTLPTDSAGAITDDVELDEAINYRDILKEGVPPQTHCEHDITGLWYLLCLTSRQMCCVDS